MNPLVFNCPPETYSGKGAYIRVNITSWYQDQVNNFTYFEWQATFQGKAWSTFEAYCVDFFTFNNSPIVNRITGWTVGQVLGSGSHTYYHAGDGSGGFNGWVKQLFYYSYSSTRWNNGTAQQASQWFSVPTIPRYPKLSFATASTTLNNMTCGVNNTRPGTITRYQVARVSDGVVLIDQSGSYSSLNFSLGGLTPNTNYSGVFKVRAYANGGWGNWLTLITSYGTTAKLPTASVSNFTTGGTPKVTLSNMNYLSSYSVVIKDGATTVKTISGITSNNYDMSLNSTELNGILGRHPNDQVITLTYTVTVISNGTSYNIGSPTSTMTIASGSYNPIFTLSNISYVDVNPISLALTGSNKKIIKNISNVQFTINAASAQGGATMSKYNISSGSRSGSVNASGSSNTLLINQIDGSSAIIQAVDSRNKYTQVTKSYDSYINYIAPSFSSVNVVRQDGIGQNVVFNLQGLYYVWSGLSQTNNIQNVKYRYKQKGTSTWSSYISIGGISYTGEIWKITNQISTGNNFNTSLEYDIELSVTDKLITTVLNLVLTSGEPLLWKDLENKSLGIGKKPLKMLDVFGDINTDGDYYKNGELFNTGKTGDTLPIGTQIPFTSLTIPDNWLLCDGSAISRIDYSELFSVIGTSYGAGDGTTTFNLPNKKGRTSVGHDSSQTEFNTVGKTGGAKTNTLTVNEMPSHSHVINYPNAGGPEVASIAQVAAANTKNTWSAEMTRTQPSGGGSAHNNLQPYQTDVWIIKAKQSSGVVATVVDTLDSTSPTNALSANMGRELKDLINDSVKGNANANNIVSNIFIGTQAEYDALPNKTGILAIIEE